MNQNFILIWGAPPSSFVQVNTTMVYEIIAALKSIIDRKSLSIAIPDVFENLKGNDTNLEMATSNTL